MTSLRNRILNYLRSWKDIDPNHWVHKGELEEAAKEAGYLGDNATRRLRELVADGLIVHRSDGNKSQEYQAI